MLSEPDYKAAFRALLKNHLEDVILLNNDLKVIESNINNADQVVNSLKASILQSVSTKSEVITKRHSIAPIGGNSVLISNPSSTIESKYTSMAAESRNAGTWDMHLSDHKIWWSPVLYTLYDRDPALGPPSFEEYVSLIHPDDQQAHIARIQNVLATGNQVQHDTSYVNATKRKWHSEGFIKGEFDENGKLYKIWGVCFDNTERVLLTKKNIELQLSEKVATELAREKQRFVSYVFHEVRCPINVVRLGLHNMYPLVRKKKEVRHSMKIMEASIDRASKILNDTIDISRFEQSEMILENRKVYMEDLVETASSLIEYSSAEKNIALIRECDHGCNVNIDIFRILQVFMNLLSNAIKFSPDNTAITLRTSVTNQSTPYLKNNVNIAPSHDCVLVEISDQGCGISFEHESRLFQAYQQINPNENQAGGGAGLGLCISRLIIEAHGGSVFVKSNHDTTGRGSTFGFFLPLVEKESFKRRAKILELEKASAAETYCSFSTRKAKYVNNYGLSLAGFNIVLVEDSKPTAFMMKKMLNNFGANVIHFDDGIPFVDFVRKSPQVAQVNFVLLDDNMVQMNGSEALEIVRAEGCALPIIMLTGNASKENAFRTLQLGASAFLEKPLSPNTLLTKLVSMNLLDSKCLVSPS